MTLKTFILLDKSQPSNNQSDESQIVFNSFIFKWLNLKTFLTKKLT